MAKQLSKPQAAKRASYASFQYWQDAQDWEELALWDIEEVASKGWSAGWKAAMAYCSGVQYGGESITEFMEPVIEQEAEG